MFNTEARSSTVVLLQCHKEHKGTELHKERDSAMEYQRLSDNRRLSDQWPSHHAFHLLFA